MCDICDGCEGFMLMGVGMGCCNGKRCDCDCHSWDSRTCSEIVLTHKRADPTLDVAAMAGMHRNKIMKYLVKNMTDKAMTDAYYINMSTPGIDGPPRTDCVHVPTNIIQLTSRVKPVACTADDSVQGYMSKWSLKSKKPEAWVVALKKAEASRPLPKIAKKPRKLKCRTT